MADMVALAPRLRPEDRAECLAASGVEPEISLPAAVGQGPTWVWTVAGRPECALGVIPVDGLPFCGAIWMLASPEILKHVRYMVTRLKDVIELMHDHYPLLGNYVDARNTTHISFIKHCGFSLLRVIPDHGVERRPFIEFAKLRNPHV
ncbi:hypothetical protein [Rhizobium leguminosarum]|uniref:hypothetical protein n=1 Tax=Rhizobium leguminosarum TaxID=384 RepID=UPI001C943113|nr:hypothetical protein [Rhizobium leguminosarum]MBY5581858.1 hypothetical protein [Rhizobium leguminosarum]